MQRGVLARSVALAWLAGLVGPVVWILIDLARLIPDELVGLLLSLLAVMVSAATAVLAAVSAVSARSTRSTQLGGLAFGLAGYSLVVLSLTSGIFTAVHHPVAEAMVLAGWISPGPDPDVWFGALRLLGLLLVAVGVVVLAHRNQRAVQQSRGVLASRLASAEQACERLADRAARRNDEIRSGLTGLSGLGELVRAPAGTRDRQRLQKAVEGQLTRLEAILDGAEGADGHYRIRTLLADVVATRPPGVGPIVVDVPAEVRVPGRRAVVGEVLSGLVASWEGVDPGAPVRIEAGESGGRVSLRVSGGPPTGPSAPDLARDRALLAADGTTLTVQDGPAGTGRVLVLTFTGSA